MNKSEIKLRGSRSSDRGLPLSWTEEPFHPPLPSKKLTNILKYDFRKPQSATSAASG